MRIAPSVRCVDACVAQPPRACTSPARGTSDALTEARAVCLSEWEAPGSCGKSPIQGQSRTNQTTGLQAKRGGHGTLLIWR